MANPDLEREIRRRFDAGDMNGAAEALVNGYGDEICGYLVVTLQSSDAADDVFSELCVHILRDLPKFRWESSVRTWAYTLARHRLYEHREAQASHRARQVPLSHSAAAQALVARLRTTKRSHLASAAQDRIAALRATLDADDQTLLILRLDRDMGWHEVAQVLGVNAAAARKRYERIKVRLRTLLDKP